MDREDVLPTQWLENVKPILASIWAVGDTTFRVDGVIRLKVKNGGQKASEVFGVAPKLPNKIIVGTAFIDKESSEIETNSQQIVTRDGLVVGIVGSFEDKNAVQLATSAVKKHEKIMKTNPAIYRETEVKTILPLSKVPVMVRNV